MKNHPHVVWKNRAKPLPSGIKEIINSLSSNQLESGIEELRSFLDLGFSQVANNKRINNPDIACLQDFYEKAKLGHKAYLGSQEENTFISRIKGLFKPIIPQFNLREFFVILYEIEGAFIGNNNVQSILQKITLEDHDQHILYETMTRRRDLIPKKVTRIEDIQGVIAGLKSNFEELLCRNFSKAAPTRRTAVIPAPVLPNNSLRGSKTNTSETLPPPLPPENPLLDPSLPLNLKLRMVAVAFQKCGFKPGTDENFNYMTCLDEVLKSDKLDKNVAKNIVRKIFGKNDEWRVDSSFKVAELLIASNNKAARHSL